MLPVALALFAVVASPPVDRQGVTGEAEAIRLHRVAAGESLIEIARQYDLGYKEIADANPHLDPFVPGAGATVTVPVRRIVPSEATPGTIVINLSERRLYYSYERARRGPPTLVTFPVGVASEGWVTPVGSYSVTEKEVNPVWRVPRSIRRERPYLPAAVTPGPDNPLGTRSLRLSSGPILIHGTNRPWGIGRRVSHGCIHLYPEDIVKLFALVRVGTPVKIVREPIKIGAQAGRVYVEVHSDPGLDLDYPRLATRLLGRKGLLSCVDDQKLLAAIDDMSGTPTDVSGNSPCR